MTSSSGIGLILCTLLWAGNAVASRSQAGRLGLPSLHILRAGLPEAAKLALLGAIFVAVGSAVRRKASVNQTNISAPQSLSFVARRIEPETSHNHHVPH